MLCAVCGVRCAVCCVLCAVCYVLLLTHTSLYSPLFSTTKGAFAEGVGSGGFSKLKNALNMHADYQIVAPKVWFALQSWYVKWFILYYDFCILKISYSKPVPIMLYNTSNKPI